MKTTKTNKIPTQTHTKYVSGFTLIELLVVISIIGVLSTMIFSSINEARQKAHIIKTAAQLKAIERGLFAATLEEGRDTYWTMAELGGSGTTRTLAYMLNRTYPDPGWAISNYLNKGHTKYFDGNNVLYYNSGSIAPACNTSTNGVNIWLLSGLFNFHLAEEWVALNTLIDGQESNMRCGKFVLRPTGTAHVYRLSHNPAVIEF